MDFWKNIQVKIFMTLYREYFLNQTQKVEPKRNGLINLTPLKKMVKDKLQGGRGLYFILSTKKHKTKSKKINFLKKDSPERQWTKDVNRHFTTKKKIGNKKEKTSAKKCNLKSTVRCYFTPRSANI